MLLSLTAAFPTEAAAAPPAEITVEQLLAAPTHDPSARPIGPLQRDPEASDAYYSGHPRISGNGQWVVFTDDRGNGTEIYRADRATGTATKISSGNGTAAKISFDGHRVVYLGENSQTSLGEAWLWEASTGARRISPAGLENVVSVTMSDDGNTIGWVQRTGLTVYTWETTIWRDGAVVGNFPDTSWLTGDGKNMIDFESGTFAFTDIDTNTRVETDQLQANGMRLDSEGVAWAGRGYYIPTETDPGGWYSMFGDVLSGIKFRIADASYGMASGQIALSPDGRNMIAYGPESTVDSSGGAVYKIDTATLAPTKLLSMWIPDDMSDDGRYAVHHDKWGNDLIYVYDLELSADQDAMVDDLARPQLSDQIGRLYQAVFNRQPDAAGLSHWLGLRASGWTMERIAAEFTAADEFQDRYGSLGDQQFIQLLYQNVMGRSADAGGQAFWLDQLAAGMTRQELVLSFSESAEFIGRTGTAKPSPKSAARIWRLYRAYFDRSADQGGFDYWYDQHRHGQSIADIASQFAASAEFASTYGDVSDSEFIRLVYQNVLGRSPDAAGVGYWESQLTAGISRGDLMVQFSESAEFIRITGSLPSD